MISHSAKKRQDSSQKSPQEIKETALYRTGTHDHESMNHDDIQNRSTHTTTSHLNKYTEHEVNAKEITYNCQNDENIFTDFSVKTHR